MHKHHYNPLIKIYDPDRYELFLDRDIILINKSTHVKFHRNLEKDINWQYIQALAEEYFDNYPGKPSFDDDQFLKSTTEYCKLVLDIFKNKEPEK